MFHHTYPCGPVVHAMVNNCRLAKSRRKVLEVLQHCWSPRFPILKQHGFREPATRKDDLRKILTKETDLLGLFLYMFQFLAGVAAAWMPKACQSCLLVWLHWISWEVNYILTYGHVLITDTGCSLETSFVYSSHNSLQIILASLWEEDHWIAIKFLGIL